MASCKKCGKQVGCGCSLKNGQCAACNSGVTVNTVVQNPATGPAPTK